MPEKRKKIRETKDEKDRKELTAASSLYLLVMLRWFLLSHPSVSHLLPHIFPFPYLRWKEGRCGKRMEVENERHGLGPPLPLFTWAQTDVFLVLTSNPLPPSGSSFLFYF